MSAVVVHSLLIDQDIFISINNISVILRQRLRCLLNSFIISFRFIPWCDVRLGRVIPQLSPAPVRPARVIYSMFIYLFIYLTIYATQHVHIWHIGLTTKQLTNYAIKLLLHFNRNFFRRMAVAVAGMSWTRYPLV